MIEAFLATELGVLITALAPGIAAVGGTVIAAILSIHKVAKVINEFRNSNEVAQLEKHLGEVVKDNSKLKKDLDKVMIEMTKRKPEGWTDDTN